VLCNQPDRRGLVGGVPDMSLAHAVAFIDHQKAQVLQFDADQVLSHKVHEHVQSTRQHGSGVRAEHEFFGQVCDALDGIAEVLVVGGHTGLADFRHYVEKHRPAAARHIVAYEVVNHPTDHELVALGRKRFLERDRTGLWPNSA
jgi:hypothetical protein